MAQEKNLKHIKSIVKQHQDQKAGLVGILQDVQNEYNYLPKEAIVCIAEEANIPLSQIYSLVTFYKTFSLKPRGKYLISLCMGTACHVRGTERILDELERILKIKSGQTSLDARFSLETVNCLGACALGPLMVINGEYYSKMNARKINSILKKYAKN